jgi:tetratricopeptide (TPR) repeat protein
MAEIFISYVEEDSALAIEIAQTVERMGLSAWYYERDSIPGRSYLLQTGEELDACRVVILLISSHSLGSYQVRQEVIRAYESNKPFIPLLVDVSHEEFRQRQPEWRAALGATSSLRIPSEGINRIIPQLTRGLAALGLRSIEHDIGSAVSPAEAQVQENLQATQAEAQRQQETERARQQERQAQRTEEEKRARYAQTFREAITQYPLSKESQRALESLQREIGITPEDAMRITKPLLDEQQAERMRQQEHQAQRDREERRLIQHALYQGGPRPQTKLVAQRQETERARHKEQRDKEENENPFSSFPTELLLSHKIFLFVLLAGSFVAIIFWVAQSRGPSQAAVSFNMAGGWKVQNKDYQGALVDYTQAITIEPSYADAYRNRGKVHVALGNKSEALADFRKAAALYDRQGKTSDSYEIDKEIRSLQNAKP